MTDRIDLGHNTFYSKIIDKHGNWIGIHEWHDCGANQTTDESGLTPGFVAFDTPEARAVTTEQAPKWTVQSREPLTLFPSLACHNCPHHGWIRDDHWVPA